MDESSTRGSRAGRENYMDKNTGLTTPVISVIMGDRDGILQARVNEVGKHSALCLFIIFNISYWSVVVE